jgi:hypothetical protein
MIIGYRFNGTEFRLHSMLSLSLLLINSSPAEQKATRIEEDMRSKMENEEGDEEVEEENEEEEEEERNEGMAQIRCWFNADLDECAALCCGGCWLCCVVVMCCTGLRLIRFHAGETDRAKE